MSDPYGYADPNAASAGQASQALYAGVFALICAAVAPCLCYMPYLAALPLGGYAIFVGSQAQRGDPSERTMATAGMLAGGVAAVLSLMVILGVVAYMILVFGVIALGN